MEKKNNNLVVILLVVIIFILGGLCVLFATGRLDFKTNNNKNSDKKEENININDKEEDTNEDLNNYQVIIDQYLDIINGNYSDDYDYTKDGKHQYIFHEYPYVKQVKNSEWSYALYDINKDGIEEMLLSNSEDSKYSNDSNYYINSIYTYNGSKIEVVDHYWSRNSLLNIYTNGIIVSHGSGGARHSGYSFKTINNDFSIDEKSCLVVSSEVNSNELPTIESIECDGKKVNYATVEELISYYVESANKIDLNSLKWNKIN